MTLKLPRASESSHFLIMGDIGTGKSSLYRQFLTQIAARGETAIIYDPHCEYTPLFYNAARGDVILNPLDARSPYWTPGDELPVGTCPHVLAEALTIATSLFPDEPTDKNRFFTERARQLFAHLLTFRPSPDTLTFWMRSERDLQRLTAGTSSASIINRDSPQTRSSMIAELNRVAETLNLLPLERDTQSRWSAREWARECRGWLFLTSRFTTREQQRPLISLWLDTLVLRLMDQYAISQQPQRIWFMLDELASLQKLPQLHTVVTETRKSGLAVVLGFQGRSQLESRYGHDAEAMLSQPATKIIFRTSEPRAAKWASEMIDDNESERVKESRSDGWRQSASHSLERSVDPVVMRSEISGLENMHAYLKYQNLVVKMHIPWIELPKRAEAFVPRVMTIKQPTRIEFPEEESESIAADISQEFHR